MEFEDEARTRVKLSSGDAPYLSVLAMGGSTASPPLSFSISEAKHQKRRSEQHDVAKRSKIDFAPASTAVAPLTAARAKNPYAQSYRLRGLGGRGRMDEFHWLAMLDVIILSSVMPDGRYLVSQRCR